MRDPRKLKVWHKAIALTLGIDRLTKRIHDRQYSSFKSQLFRAALSIPSNIAEGRRRESAKDFAKFLSIAAGSSSEVETQLILGRRAEIIDEAAYVTLVGQTVEVRKMLYGLIKRLNEE